MKKKLLAILLSAACVLSLAACGAADSETVSQTEEATTEETETGEEVQDAQEDAASGTELAENTEAAETEASESEEVAADETVEEHPVIWRMDEEGIKNEDLGVLLRRDNGIMEDLSLNLSMTVSWEDEDISPLQEFKCDYYAGDLDEFIAENADFEKGKLGNECEYAYRIDEPNSTKFAFVGNGMVLTTYVGFNSNAEPKENVDINDYLEQMNLQSCEEFSQDGFAYITDEGLFCPAIGVSITYEESKTEVNGQYAWLAPNSDDYWHYLEIASFRSWGSAQEVVDTYVENKTQYDGDYIEIEGTVETTIGGYRYLGRGVTKEWMGEKNLAEWKFVSDDIIWSIDFKCEVDEGHEAYLSIIEPLS